MSYLKNIIRKSIFLFLFFVCLSTDVVANDLSPSLMYPFEQADLIYINKNTKKKHSHTQYKIKRKPKKDGDIYTLVSKGEGNYGRMKNVRWIKSAQMQQNGNILRVLESQIEIFDDSNQLFFRKEKSFDYRKKLITFKRFDGSNKLIKQKQIRIKGPTCDEFTLGHFLKSYIHNKHSSDKTHFYLATNEPNYYHVRIINRGIEKIQIPEVGWYSAQKYQLMAELGPLTKVMAKIVPPTYIWYQIQHPYEWLQYEGKETGVNSPSVVATVQERIPPVKF